ncbi:MAG: hypothetical protein JEZ06_04955 [Anaerolineaceae bacterium]|nr:hypothetical protein [Anaerolineaceae bacterium]
MIILKNLQKLENQKNVLDIEHLQIVQGEISAVIGAADSGIDPDWGFIDQHDAHQYAWFLGSSPLLDALSRVTEDLYYIYV